MFILTKEKFEMKVFLLVFALMFSTLGFAWEPTKPITANMNMPAGSPADNEFRIISQQVEKNTGAKFIANYRLGAGGTIGNEAFSKSPADGYTVAPIPIPGLTGTDRMVNPNKSYTNSDFIFATIGASTPMTIIANPNDPVNSLQDLVKVLKTEKTTMGDPGSGGRIAYELFRSVAKLEESNDRIVRVEYKGPTEVVQDVISKNLRYGVVPLASSIQNHLAGKIKIIAVTSDTRIASIPDVPTVSSVYPSMVYNLSWAISLPKGTPSDIVEWYTKEFNKASLDPEVQKVLHDNFFFMDKKLMNPKELTAKINSDEKRFAPIVDRVIEHQKK